MSYILFFFFVAFYGTILFWGLGYLIGNKHIRDYGGFSILVIPYHLFISFLLGLPLMFIFMRIYKLIFKYKISTPFLILLKAGVASLYIGIILLLLLYKSYKASDINYTDYFNYHILYSACLLFALVLGIIINKLKQKYLSK